MVVELDDSIPAEVKRRFGHAIKRAVAETGESSICEVSMLPPMPRQVDFQMPLSQPCADLKVQFHKLYRYSTGDRLLGWIVGMDKHDARLAREFIEKHYDR